MSATTPAKPRRDTLNLRISAEERSLIERAALATGKTRTDFILQAARGAAEATLLDRALLAVSAQAYAEFLQRLDAPPAANARLRRTMRARLPWTKA